VFGIGLYKHSYKYLFPIEPTGKAVAASGDGIILMTLYCSEGFQEQCLFCNTKEEIMSDQTLPDLNESNQVINAQPETTSNQVVPPSAIINGNLSVTNYVAVGPFAIGPGQGIIETTGSVAAFSFVRRNLTSWPAQPAAGDRFVWYSPNGTARLWTEGNQDLLTITARGNVGIGTTNPIGKLHLEDGSVPDSKIKFGNSEGGVHHLSSKRDIVFNSDNPYGTERGCFYFRKTPFEDLASHQDLVVITEAGNLKATGDVYAKGILLTSSRELKENIAEFSGKEAVEALKILNPVKFNFKADSDKNLHIGFIAEDVPELVATSDRKTLSPMDIVAVLTQALKEQQNTILALAEKVKVLEAKAA